MAKMWTSEKNICRKYSVDFHTMVEESTSFCSTENYNNGLICNVLLTQAKFSRKMYSHKQLYLA